MSLFEINEPKNLKKNSNREFQNTQKYLFGEGQVVVLSRLVTIDFSTI